MTSRRIPVEAGHIRMFALSLGETNPAYFGANDANGDRSSDVLAPPTFVEVGHHYDPDRAIPTLGVPWKGSGSEPTGISSGEAATGLMAAERTFEYHLPIRAGDVLEVDVTGVRSWTKQGRRGGTLLFEETTFNYHNQDGQLVLTVQKVTVMPQQTVAG